jgi:voltage-gated potassium channel
VQDHTVREPKPKRVIDLPLMRRIRWHLRRARGQIDRKFVVVVLGSLAILVLALSLLVTVLEKEVTFPSFVATVYWAFNTVLGSGDPSFVVTPIGGIVNYLLQILGLTLLAVATGVLIGFIIDFLLKEGQGMGAPGYREHIVICGWNGNARELVEEFRGDDYRAQVVVLHEADKNPAGGGVYFINGDPTSAQDLERAGIRDASAAIVFPVEPTNEADMRSILTILAIESLAPHVRTVAEVVNPRHLDHFRRTHVDEVLVTSRLAARLLARSALYPGLTELVTDIVSGGEGSELYRVRVPETYLGLSIDDVAARLRADHRATLISINRDGSSFVNPPADFRVQPGDDALVVAESLGTLAPLRLQRAAHV